MADSNITVSGLEVSPSVEHINAKWSFKDPNEKGLPYLELDAVELWAASSNDRSLATKVGQAPAYLAKKLTQPLLTNLANMAYEYPGRVRALASRGRADPRAG